MDFGDLNQSQEYTHINLSGNHTTIDLAFVSSLELLISCTTVPPLSSSDHLGFKLCFYITLPRHLLNCVSKTVWCYQEADFEKANNLLSQLQWDSLVNDQHGVDTSWMNWYNHFTHTMSECIPKKRIVSDNRTPWISEDILKAIRRRNRLFAAYKKSGNEYKLVEYKYTRNAIVSAIRVSKVKFFQKLHTADKKSFWKMVKRLTNNRSTIPTLIHNDVQISDDVSKAEVLNNEFYNNFNHAKHLSAVVKSRYTTDPENCPTNFVCTDHMVHELIVNLDICKSSGTDDVSARMLKATADITTPTLTRLFNMSIRTGLFPDCWKTARIVPIPKKGSNTNPGNYRPVSILPILSKVFERIIYTLVSKHLKVHSPISPYQFGFSSGKSTTSALLALSNGILQSLDQGVEVVSVFFDLSKAFDSVPHALLLQKLIDINVNPYLFNLIYSYLTERNQFVVVNGSQSTQVKVTSGVPQGSVLGPLLFLIYINGITCANINGQVSIYADDIALYKVIQSPLDYQSIQDDINTICLWTEDNNLKLNASKCCYVLFSKKSQPCLPNTQLLINDQALQRVTSFKYLGVTFSYDGSWSAHITNVCQNVRKVLGLLYRRFSQGSRSDTLLYLYKMLVRPHLEYACSIWDPHLKRDIDKLERVQSFALKICLKQWSPYTSYRELLERAELQSLASRRQYFKQCQLFSMLNGISFCVSPPTTRIVAAPASARTRSVVASSLVQPFARTELFFNSFYPSAIRLWNSLPHEITKCETLQAFKRALLKYMSEHRQLNYFYTV